MFRNSDFDIFEDKTLNGRMEKIKTIIDPKFEEFASIALPILNYRWSKMVCTRS